MNNPSIGYKSHDEPSNDILIKSMEIVWMCLRGLDVIYLDKGP